MYLIRVLSEQRRSFQFESQIQEDHLDGSSRTIVSDSNVLIRPTLVVAVSVVDGLEYIKALRNDAENGSLPIQRRSCLSTL